jgi:hypothetical protein
MGINSQLDNLLNALCTSWSDSGIGDNCDKCVSETVATMNKHIGPLGYKILFTDASDENVRVFTWVHSIP